MYIISHFLLSPLHFRTVFSLFLLKNPEHVVYLYFLFQLHGWVSFLVWVQVVCFLGYFLFTLLLGVCSCISYRSRRLESPVSQKSCCLFSRWSTILMKGLQHSEWGRQTYSHHCFWATFQYEKHFYFDLSYSLLITLWILFLPTSSPEKLGQIVS